MIIINYNPDTGRVIGLNQQTEHYITLDTDPRTPLPDKYSYYAVVDGQFCVKRRLPTSDEGRADKIATIKAAIADIENWMSQGIDWVVKLVCGDVKKTDTEWIQYLVQRASKKDELAKLQDALAELQDGTNQSETR